MKQIKVKVNEYWKNFTYKLNSKQQDILSSNIFFEYDSKTTLFDFFKYLNSVFFDIIINFEQLDYKEMNYKRKIRSRYRILNRKKFLYIYDLNSKFETVVKLFHFNEIEVFFSFFMEIGGRLLELNGMEFYMHSREKGKHKLPHIHVKYQGDEVVISLDGKILEGKIKSKVQSLAQEIIKSDKESFLIKWNNLTDGEKFRFINKELIRLDSSFDF